MVLHGALICMCDTGFAVRYMSDLDHGPVRLDLHLSGPVEHCARETSTYQKCRRQSKSL